jgi:hypothetical protein
MRGLLGGLLLSLISGAALADDPLIVGNPNSCHIKIDYEAGEQLLHLRPTVPAGAGCEITPLMLQVGLYQALGQHRSGVVRSIFLGRLESYPWLSETLFERARFSSTGPGFWDETTGHPADGSSDNEYVADVLYEKVASKCLFDVCRRPVFGEIKAVLSELGYSLTGVSVEKVLKRHAPAVGGESMIPAGIFPFDALVHLRIGKSG